MARRGTLYRCHLFSFGGPQTEGVISHWTQNLVSIGDDEVMSEEEVELYISIDRGNYEVSSEAHIRFDILEQDYLITGGLDDKIVSILGTGASQPDSDYRTENKITEFFRLSELMPLQVFIRNYKQQYPDEFQNHILVLEDTISDHTIYHIVTWWTAQRLADFLNSEFYFIVNIDEQFEDQTEDILNVSANTLPSEPSVQIPWHPRAITRRIFTLLSTGALDWSISDTEALEAFIILRTLEPQTLVRTVQIMRHSSIWSRLAAKMSEAESTISASFFNWSLRVDPNHGYIVPGDEIEIIIRAGSTPEPERGLSGRYQIGDDGLAQLPLIQNPVLVGLLPSEAANIIARAYIDADLIRFPQVTLFFALRGSGYIDVANQLATGEHAFRHSSNITTDPSSPEYQRTRKLFQFTSYIQGIQSRDQFTISALLHYYNWIEENRNQPVFLTREPTELWEWALDQASEPPTVSPMEPFLALIRSVMARMNQDIPEDRDRTQRTLNLYLDWMEHHWDDSNLSQTDPVTIWVQMSGRVLDAEIVEMRHRIESEANRPHPIDWKAVGHKLDEAIALMMRNVWLVEPTRIEQGVVESGGIGPFFRERRGVGWLISASELEHRVRNLIAGEFLNDLMQRATDEGFTEINVRDVFIDWVTNRPEILDALILAHNYPETERFEFQVDLPAWQTAVEIGIGFIPIVGQVVAVFEITTDTSLFGRPLSTIERSILGAAILLPAAARLVGTGGRLMRASRIIQTYRLTGREAEALYRAAMPIRPGSPGAELLRRLSSDIRSGRSVHDRNTIGEARELLKQMGMMDRRTAHALNISSRGPMQGAELSSEERTTRLIFEAFGGETAAYRSLNPEARQAIRAGVAIDHTFFRRAIRAETQEGLIRYSREVAEQMRLRNIPESQIQRFQETVAELNSSWRSSLASQLVPRVRERIVDLGRTEALRDQGEVMIGEFRRRARLYEDRATSAATAAKRQQARARVRAIEREIEDIQNWLAPANSVNWRLNVLQQEVAHSQYLRSLVAEGGSPMLQRIWIQHQIRGIRSSLERYTSIMQRHYRGNFGEYEVAFRIADDYIILKPPDEFVTRAGIDLIAIPRGGRGRVAVIDNKALAKRIERSVSALIRNLPRNLAAGIDEFSELMARDPHLPSEFSEAMQRLTVANSEIQQLVQGMSREAIGRSTIVQRQIRQILDRYGIERVVTNAGGQVDELTPTLRGFGIDLADLN